MKLITATIIVVAAVLAAACGDAPERSESGETQVVSTPVSPPQVPTATPAPTVYSDGWLIHVRGGVVLASPLDGGAEVRLNAGGVAPALAQYVGVVDDGEDTWVYLLAPVQRVDTPNGGAYYDARVIRTSLSTGASEDVLPDAGDLYLSDGAAQYVSVSSDGRRIAYGLSDGVHVAQVDSAIDDFLVSTQCADSERCPQYRSPLWSPDGASLLITKQLYEGSHLALVRLSDPATVHEFEDMSGDAKSWSHDSSRICALPDIFVPDGIWLINAATFERRPFDRDSHGVRVAGTRCVFAPSGTIALGFGRDGTDDGALASAILGADNPAATPIAIPAPYTTVEAWLPDGSGVIVSGYAPCVPCGERDPSVAVLLPDGTVRSLPFVAGRVLAVIPPP